MSFKKKSCAASVLRSLTRIGPAEGDPFVGGEVHGFTDVYSEVGEVGQRLLTTQVL